MAFPPTHLLVGAGVAELVRSSGAPLPRWRAWLLGAALAVAPDGDFALGIALGKGGEYHGTFTHSLTLTVLVGAIAAAFWGRQWGVLAGATYGSHLLVDLLDDRGRTNVLLAWPFSHERPFAIGAVFPTIPFEQGEGVTGAILSLFRPDVLAALLLQTAYGVAFFAGLLVLSWLLRRFVPRRVVIDRRAA